MSKIQIVIAEACGLVHTGLRTILESSKDLAIEGEVRCKKTLFQLLQTLKLTPDVCILSIPLAPENSYKILLELRSLYPTMSVIMLAQYAPKMGVQRALLDGAAAFLLKGKAEVELLNAVFAVYEDDYYLNDTVTLRLMRTLHDRNTVRACITHEELEFLSRCCQDEKYSNIARDLNISDRKVQHLREGLFQKMKVSCRSGLVLAAVRLGLYQCSQTV